MSKKLLMALACSVLLMGLAACGSNDKASTSEEPKQETKKEEEQKKLDEQKQEDEQKKIEEQKKAEEQRKQEEATKKDQSTITSGNTIKGLKDELSIGMSFKDYLAKKKSLNVENPFSISLGKGNVGSVLQAQDGVLVVCIDGEKIFDLKTFKNVDEAKEYEKGLKVKH
ncbi:hypothetical protein I6G76_01395 (plasmid) [Bacillus cereus]|uniref:Lipoprotein n=1 Tax=Bacillus cereus (strain ZK / E33L) TaxID=288681 RepID=Q4V143_BACCZ|nr:hypothetical protein [Bacillus cereus]AAY60564.1 hypothetical protein pE33L466_0426 [Bacillus cereus E33L]AJI25980.1 hypothetical protein BF28_5844 [Bacillus cereus E33L]QQA18988.1 hypothetical protein I6G76_01395 [Bacillus cereus]